MSPDELERLLHRDFEKTLTSEDEEALLELLRADDDAADRFVEWSEMESALVESLNEETELPSGVHSILRKTRRSAWAARRPENLVPWPSIAVSLLFALAAWLLVLRGAPATPEPLAGAALPRSRERGEEEKLRSSTVPDLPQKADDRPTEAEEEDRRARKAQETPVGDATLDVRRDASRPIVVPELREKEPTPGPPGKASDPDPEKPTPQSEARQPRAILERVEGNVARIGDPEDARLAAGDELLPSQGLEIRGAKSAVTLRLDEGTRLDLQGDSRLEKIQYSVEQRTIKLTRGALRATVSKQAARKSIVFQTPHAEVTVVGTRLLLQVLTDLTRVEVEEGRVRSRRLPDGAAIDIPSGFFAQFGKGISSALKPVLVVRSFQDGISPTPDYAGTRDTSISSKSSGTNAGALDQLHVWSGTYEAPWVALIRWDLTSIPARSKIVSAEVSFWITGGMGPPTARLLDIRRPWEEMEATWRAAASGRSWQSAGAQGDADRGSKVLGLLAPASTGNSSFPLNEAGVALIQQWVQTPLSNNGISISRDPADGAWDLASREWPNADHRPKLTVTYIPAIK